jgi:hypothetical protein
MNRDRITRNSEHNDSAQRERALCRKLLPALREGAESENRQVARLALDVIIHAVVQHMETAA